MRIEKFKNSFFFLILFSAVYITTFTAIMCKYENIGLFGYDLHSISDRGDIEVYFQRSSWLQNNKYPYKEEIIEYPQIAVYYFALPLLFTDNLETYIILFRIMSSIITFFLTVVISKILQLMNKSINYTYLYLLPGTFYFSINRYDALPALFILLSIYLFLKNKHLLSFFTLTLAIWTKWYAILLFPLFLKLHRSREKTYSKPILILAISSFFILLPTLLTVSIDNILDTYKFHSKREYNRESIAGVIVYATGYDSFGEINLGSIVIGNVLFTFLQFSIVFYLVFVKIEGLDQFLSAAAFSILWFILFSKFYSPQWLIWLIPFSIFLIKEKKDILILSALSILNYLDYPIFYAYTLEIEKGISLYIIVTIRIIIMFYLLVLYYKTSKLDTYSNFSPNKV